MKKSDIGLIIGVLVIIIISAFVSVGKPFEKVTLNGLGYAISEETGNYDNEEVADKIKDEYEDYIAIDYNEYNELLESKDYFFIAIGRTGCGYCDQYKPVLKEVSEELELPLHYIDVANLEEDEIEEFSTSNDFLKSNEWGTPTTLILNKDKVIASQQGYVDAQELKDFIKEYVKLDGEE